MRSVFQEDYNHMKSKSGVILCLPGAAFKNVVTGQHHLKISTRIIYLADAQSGLRDTQPSPMDKHYEKQRNYVSASWLLDAARAIRRQS